jgi:hypothetical protein
MDVDIFSAKVSEKQKLASIERYSGLIYTPGLLRLTKHITSTT